MIIFHWPRIQKICLENLLVLRSKAVGIFAETTEKVETEVRSEKKNEGQAGSRSPSQQGIRHFLMKIWCVVTKKSGKKSHGSTGI